MIYSYYIWIQFITCLIVRVQTYVIRNKHALHRKRNWFTAEYARNNLNGPTQIRTRNEHWDAPWLLSVLTIHGASKCGSPKLSWSLLEITNSACSYWNFIALYIIADSTLGSHKRFRSQSAFSLASHVRTKKK